MALGGGDNFSRWSIRSILQRKKMIILRLTLHATTTATTSSYMSISLLNTLVPIGTPCFHSPYYTNTILMYPCQGHGGHSKHMFQEMPFMVPKILISIEALCQCIFIELEGNT